ncbi:MAG: tetratricopeptide repeat protein [Anaerolineae bacterium]|nr:tetratricopeptide repeat protein [Anaerolineae bacterium]
MAHEILIGNRYQLGDKLGGGGMGVVYRAYDRLTGQAVALKRVTVPDEQLQFASMDTSENVRLALAREFKTLASLRHPNIISVLDYGFDAQRQPYFTMELLEGAQTILAAGEEQPEEIRAGLIVQLLQALAYLHRRGILHRDIKPANALVQDSEVKALDFGLAATLDQAQDFVGTVAYMAPELLRGAPASVASDLYAVGMIAYELFAGFYPFDSIHPRHLILEITRRVPDFSAVSNPRLAGLLSGWLDKDPDRRPGHADEAIAALSEAVGQGPPEESAAIRESFLQAARFIGRDAEFATLTGAFDRAARGEGSAWLVGGESGVGKSRLMDELRAYALVEGAVALRGQAVEGGGRPYQIWRDVVRRLALSVDLTDLEAGALKEIVPDIDALLGRDVPDAAGLGDETGRQRLNLIIVDMLCRQARRQPLMLILEDLQWADKDLEPLQQLGRLVDGLSLLIVGSYRNDECPDLPVRLPGVMVLSLQRLGEAHIAELSASMLGESGRQPQVLGFLERETEGNVFFLVEVVRALAEEAGHLRGIGRMTLPHAVVAGGVRRLIRRRLERLPDEDRPLLKLAAVAGRVLDLAVLRAAAPGVDLNAWLIRGANVAALDVQEGRWRFTHDKLREMLLDDLTDDECPVLHRKIAEAVETVYAGDLTSYAVPLAEHWYAAGDVDKALLYTQIAGDQLLSVSAFRRALAFFERAMVLLSSGGEEETPEHAALLVSIGRAYEGMHSAFAKQYLEAGFKLAHAAGSYRTAVMALNGLSWHSLGEGAYEESKRYAEQGLALAREIDDRSDMAYALRALGCVAIECGQAEAAKPYLIESVAVYREENELSNMVHVLLDLGDVTRAQGDYAAAQQFLEEALAIAEKLSWHVGAELLEGNPIPRFWSIPVNLGRVAYAKGEYEEAKRLCLRSLAVCRRFGMPWSTSFTLYHLGRACYALGEYHEAQEHFIEAFKIAVDIQVIPLVAYVMIGMAVVLIHAGKNRQARAVLAAILNHPVSNRETKDEAECLLNRLEPEPASLPGEREAAADLEAMASALVDEFALP